MTDGLKLEERVDIDTRTKVAQVPCLVGHPCFADLLLAAFWECGARQVPLPTGSSGVASFGLLEDAIVEILKEDLGRDALLDSFERWTNGATDGWLNSARASCQLCRWIEGCQESPSIRAFRGGRRSSRCGRLEHGIDGMRSARRKTIDVATVAVEAPGVPALGEGGRYIM